MDEELLDFQMLRRALFESHRGEDLVEGACPRCAGLWPEEPSDDPSAE